MTQANPYPLRVEKIIMEKFKILSAQNGRSVNKEIEMLMKQSIIDYEKENGEIIINPDT